MQAENLQRQHDGEEEREDIDVDDDSQLMGKELQDSSDASFDEVQEMDIVIQESSVEGKDTAIEEDHDAQNQVDAAGVEKNASKRSSRRANGNGGKERKAPYQIRKSDIPLYSVDETGSLEELSLRSRSSLSPESSFDMGYAEPQLAQQPTMTVRPWMDDPAMGGFNPLPQRKALHQTPCKRLARSKLPFANMPDRMDQALIMIQNDINYLKKGNFAGSKLMQLNGSPHERKKTLLKQRSRSTEPVLVGRMHKVRSDAEVPQRSSSGLGRGRRSVSTYSHDTKMKKLSEITAANSHSLPSKEMFNSTKVHSIPVAIFSILSPEEAREKNSMPSKPKYLTRISLDAGKLPPLNKRTERDGVHLPYVNTPMEPYLQLLKKGQQSHAASEIPVSLVP